METSWISKELDSSAQSLSLLLNHQPSWNFSVVLCVSMSRRTRIDSLFGRLRLNLTFLKPLWTFIVLNWFGRRNSSLSSNHIRCVRGVMRTQWVQSSQFDHTLSVKSSFLLWKVTHQAAELPFNVGLYLNDPEQPERDAQKNIQYLLRAFDHITWSSSVGGDDSWNTVIYISVFLWSAEDHSAWSDMSLKDKDHPQGWEGDYMYYIRCRRWRDQKPAHSPGVSLSKTLSSLCLVVCTCSKYMLFEAVFLASDVWMSLPRMHTNFLFEVIVYLFVFICTKYILLRNS